MTVDAFAFRYGASDDPSFFAELFLTSPDFDSETLRGILKGLAYRQIPQGRAEMAALIAKECKQYTTVRLSVMEHLTLRPRRWLAFKLGKATRFPDCQDPRDLVVGRGTDTWYGPLIPSGDRSAHWYIRPEYIPHWDTPEGLSEAQEFRIRWLCFARIDSRTVSIHWRGFSYAPSKGAADRNNSQFPYWLHIPRFFKEISELVQASLEDINLHKLIIFDLWDQYRYDHDYKWRDRGIRARSRGVALSARSGVYSEEHEMRGLLGFASAIRESIQERLRDKHGMTLPEPRTYDEVVLQTLIQQYGALSYEFSLLNASGEVLFDANSYFGVKPSYPNQDAFPHLNVHVSKRSDLDQLRFLLDHVDVTHRDNTRAITDRASQHPQLPLL